MRDRWLTFLTVSLLLTACDGARQPARLPDPTATRTVQATSVSSPVSAPATATPVQISPAGDGIVDGWAVLAEKDLYADVDMTDLDVDYINIRRLHEALSSQGWQEDHLRELREFDQQELREALAWLAANADGDDIVFLYVTAHSTYLRENVNWAGFFAADWAALPAGERVLIVDACTAAEFIAPVEADPRPHLSIATSGLDEYGWTGLEEEGLPIIGTPFVFYFTAALDELGTDADGDGRVSVQEAALMAGGQQATYLHEVVLAVPEFLALYHNIGSYPDQDPGYPHVSMDDTIGAPLLLTLDVP